MELYPGFPEAWYRVPRWWPVARQLGSMLTELHTWAMRGHRITLNGTNIYAGIPVHHHPILIASMRQNLERVWPLREAQIRKAMIEGIADISVAVTAPFGVDVIAAALVDHGYIKTMGGFKVC